MMVAWKEIVRTLLPRSYRQHKIRKGDLRGSTIVTSWHDYPAAILGYAEVELLQWISTNVRASEHWADLGAHYGYVSLALCKAVGPTGRVLAFEPSLSTAGYLLKTRECNKLSQLTVLPFGLSSEPFMNVLHLPSTRGMLDSQLSDVNEVPREQCLSIGFDSLCSIAPSLVQRLDGVKIDVQGMELEVLQGMRESLRLMKPKIALEIHHDVSRKSILEVLQECGYGTHPMPIGGEEVDFYDSKVNHSFIFLPRP